MVCYNVEYDLGYLGQMMNGMSRATKCCINPKYGSPCSLAPFHALLLYVRSGKQRRVISNSTVCFLHPWKYYKLSQLFWNIQVER